MKKALALLAEFFLFLLLDVIGGIFYHPFKIETTWTGSQVAPRSFFWDGILMMLIAWVLLLLISTFRKRLAAWAPAATLALILATLVGFFLKVGVVTHKW